MNSPIAVIILNYFGSATTQNCIRSVQTVLAPDIFLVDNSADQTERSKILNIFRHNDNVRLLFPSENLGFAAGVNLGIRTALKEGFTRFLLLNNDAILLNGARELLLNAYDEWPSALISPIIRWNNQINKGYYYHKYLGLILLNKPWNLNKWLFFLSGCSLAFDKSFLERVGFLNEIFFMYGEDVELCHRAYANQIPIVLLENELVVHSGSHSSKTASFFFEYHMLRAHYLLSVLLFNHPLKKISAIFGKLLVLSFRSFYRSIKYRTLAPLMALFVAPLPLKVRPNQIYIHQLHEKN
jgi:GT2 family glycosyltransferase